MPLFRLVRAKIRTDIYFDYEYEKPPKEMFYSWVFVNGLRQIKFQQKKMITPISIVKQMQYLKLDRNDLCKRL